jgi:predicted ArsR family transcriptional regulator
VTTRKSKDSTRDIILRALKNTTGATVDELAEVADVSPVTVRHHLNALQGEGLLLSDTVRRKVGRPHYVYSLSEDGHELFPKKYARLSSRLLQEMKHQFSPEMVSELFDHVVSRIVEENRKDFENLSFRQRLNFLVELLAEEGFLARWEETEQGEFRLIETSCPYISVGQSHDEICSFDTGLMSAIMSTEVKQHSCMLGGDSCCQFTIVPPEQIEAR